MAADRGKRTSGSRGVLSQIDARIADLDRELVKAGELLAERRRLVAARATITGQRQASPGPLARRITQQDIAVYLAEHPGARASEMARALDVPLTNISQHLHRGRLTRFERKSDGWHLRNSSDPAIAQRRTAGRRRGKPQDSGGSGR